MTFSVGDIDLVHSYNVVPITTKPFVVSYEGELPRILKGAFRETARNFLYARLLSEQCKGLYPISNFADRLSFRHARGHAAANQIRVRSSVMYPGIELRVDRPRKLSSKDVVLTFVGKQWARKGGAAIAKAAAIAKNLRLPVQFNVVSAMNYGLSIYTDTHADFYSEYVKHLGLDNIKFFHKISNSDVLSLMSRSDFSLLPTFDDSFGFSVLEGMSYGVPAIASGVCAIPEVVTHLGNGFLLDLPVDEIGRWRFLQMSGEERRKSSYKDILSQSLTATANNIIAAIELVLHDRGLYERLSFGVITTIREKFDVEKLSCQWAQIYARSTSRGAI